MNRRLQYLLVEIKKADARVRGRESRRVEPYNRLSDLMTELYQLLRGSSIEEVERCFKS